MVAVVEVMEVHNKVFTVAYDRSGRARCKKCKVMICRLNHIMRTLV